jgi:hypothetical protein
LLLEGHVAPDPAVIAAPDRGIGDMLIGSEHSERCL